MRQLKHILDRYLLNLFFESLCPLCQRLTSDEICLNCWLKLQRNQIPECNSIEDLSPPVLTWGEYSGDLRRAIAALKYENQSDLGNLLGHALGEKWISLSRNSTERLFLAKRFKHTIVLPIPLHVNKLKKRGYNQALIIANAFCNITGMTCDKHGLRRVRETQAQFGLSVKDRERNLTKAFQVTPTWVQRSLPADIILIDDIYTTGATARAASQVLQNTGYNVLGIAVIARPNMQSEKIWEK